jgi:medium-chain acyl-[acyl-carrier-protein] hydrolase
VNSDDEYLSSGMTTTGARNPWLPFSSHREAAVRLLCFPHAGAGAATYRSWGAGMPAAIGVCPVQPPGRENRRKEAPMTNVEVLARSMAAAVAPVLLPPYALFGHSTGALAAFAFARELRRRRAPAPTHLFVAGRRAPQLPMERTELAGLDPAGLEVALRQMGGTPEEVMRDHEILRWIHPLLVADFAMNEDYRHHDEQPLDMPITAFAADADAGSSCDEVAQWAEQTSQTFVQHTIKGGHFAIFDHASAVCAWIGAALLL